MRVYLETLGCRQNLSEIETLGRQLTAMGHQVVPTPEAAGANLALDMREARLL